MPEGRESNTLQEISPRGSGSECAVEGVAVWLLHRDDGVARWPRHVCATRDVIIGYTLP